MDKQELDAVVVYMGNLWNREIGYASRAAGLKLLSGLPAEAVENAVMAIAEDGRDTLPPWPLIAKTARSLAATMREAVPQLPAHDVLSDEEHRGVMIQLRAKETAEQRRRADRMSAETSNLPMKVRLMLARDLLTGGVSKLPAGSWDALFEDNLAREFRLHAPLVPAGRKDLE